MHFDHKAILKSNNIQKINGSVEKGYRTKIECCDTIITYCMLIDKLQKEIKMLNDENQKFKNKYINNEGLITETDIDMISQINKLIINKKNLRKNYSNKIKELKDYHNI